MVTSDLRAEMEIWPFRACAMHPVLQFGHCELGYGADTRFAERILLSCYVMLCYAYCDL